MQLSDIRAKFADYSSLTNDERKELFDKVQKNLAELKLNSPTEYLDILKQLQAAAEQVEAALAKI